MCSPVGALGARLWPLGPTMAASCCGEVGGEHGGVH